MRVSTIATALLSFAIATQGVAVPSKVEPQAELDTYFAKLPSKTVYVHEVDPNAVGEDGKPVPKDLVFAQAWSLTKDQGRHVLDLEKKLKDHKRSISTNPAAEVISELDKRDDGRWGRWRSVSVCYRDPYWVSQYSLQSAKNQVCNIFQDWVGGNVNAAVWQEIKLETWPDGNVWRQWFGLPQGQLGLDVWFRYVDDRGWVWDRCFDSFYDLIYDCRGSNPDSAGGNFQWCSNGPTCYPMQSSHIWTRPRGG
ncbi:hypothetical protein ABW19_dt0208522 [Dactylella cylindrospora]|nr:hypothetical protein ABW19_dt0208522 [Dactylella cylindrospora]